MRPFVPLATYRIQLTREFTFSQCAALVPYLASLGISTVYCSPVLQAVPGSTHGYDTVDPTRLSDDLGGMSGWTALAHAAREHWMNLLLDIVPNHMAASTVNPWWRDVLEHGRLSPFAGVFDINWEPGEARLRNRVLLPVLAESLGEAIANGRLSVDLSAFGLVLTYGELQLPLDVRSYRHVLSPVAATHAGSLPPEFVRLTRAAAALHSVRELPVSRPDLLYEVRLSIKRQLLGLLDVGAAEPDRAHAALGALVRDAASTLTHDGLQRLLQEQHYTLEYWKTGRHHVNYRRFFDINDLAGVRIEDSSVYERTHAFLRELAASSPVCGFRVDHVDGLREPLIYLKRLRSIPVSAMCERPGHTPYVVVEKILAIGETLPDKWPVEGTTGYDFLTEVTGLFIDAPGLKTLQRHYRETTKTRSVRGKLTIANKRRVLEQSFRPELARLASALMPAAEWLYPMYELTNARLSRAIIDVTAALPVYRTYSTARSGFSSQDCRHIARALSQCASHLTRNTDDVAFEVVERALTLDIPRSAPTRVRQSVQEFLLRWQQLSGAAMAKGFEDTTLYQDGAFIALNDVGAPETLAPTTPEQFHNWNSLRCADWPHTMNCTATHDTKRGEDVRARLAVLSEMSQEWTAAVDRWFALLAADEMAGEVVRAVDASTHLFLLQTIVGAWPENEAPDAFAERLEQYMIKVAREAKTRSSWLEPDEEYERALGALVQYAVSDETATRFGDCFGELIGTLRFHGLVNSLVQSLLKIASPGIPDLYQGAELLDLSLVDPDNRRPVDYERRHALLQQLHVHAVDRQQLARELVARWPDERAKLYVTTQALKLRQHLAHVFQAGEYVPLTCRGTKGPHACAFMRRHKSDCVVAVAPVRSLNLAGERRLPLGATAWGTTEIALPPGSPQEYEDVFTGACVSAVDGVLNLAELLRQFPVALLEGCIKR